MLTKAEYEQQFVGPGLMLKLAAHGWIDIVLWSPGQSTLLSASYLSDGMSRFLAAVLALVESKEESAYSIVCLDEEPGWHILRFWRDGTSVRIVHLYDEDERSRPSSEDLVNSLQLYQQPLFDAVLPLDTLVFAVWSQFAQLLATLGKRRYLKLWGFPFPKEQYKRLTMHKRAAVKRLHASKTD